jgi:hypothetical protein
MKQILKARERYKAEEAAKKAKEVDSGAIPKDSR